MFSIKNLANERWIRFSSIVTWAVVKVRYVIKNVLSKSASVYTWYVSLSTSFNNVAPWNRIILAEHESYRFTSHYSRKFACLTLIIDPSNTIFVGESGSANRYFSTGGICKGFFRSMSSNTLFRLRSNILNTDKQVNYNSGSMKSSNSAKRSTIQDTSPFNIQHN